LIKHVYQDVYLTGNEVDLTKIEEVPYVLKEDLNLDVVTEKAKKAINDGEVAVVLLAGGQGTRLEHTGPKGTFSFEVVSLCQLQESELCKYKKVDGALPVPLYIMTSDITHEETVSFFKEHAYFAVPEENIHFFKQEHFPPLSKDGELLLTPDKDIMLTPNGNGGIFASLKNSCMLEEMEARGVTQVFMTNVDNV